MIRFLTVFFLLLICFPPQEARGAGTAELNGPSFFLSAKVDPDEVYNEIIGNVLSYIRISAPFLDLSVFTGNGGAEYNYILPDFWLGIFAGLLTLTLCLGIFPAKKAFFEQSAAAMLHQPKDALRCGLVFYIILMSLVVIFLLSVVGFPAAVFFIVIIMIFTILGEIALGIWLGALIAGDLGMGMSPYTNMAMGVALIEITKLIPYVGGAVSLFILPVMALGAAVNGLLNVYIRHLFYPPPYDREYPKRTGKDEIDRLRGIILPEKNREE